MSVNSDHIGYLFAAELQFRLTSAVRLATTLNKQPLDLPMEWSHGRHTVRYEEVALRQDQADFAACTTHRCATYLMAVAMKDAIIATVADPENHSDPRISAAWQIVRLIRNAFTHSPFNPTWSMEPKYRDRVFEVPGIIRLDTTGLQGQPFDWHHYGGPLALLKLCRFVRIGILGDPSGPRRVIPLPKTRYVHQGGVLLEEVDEIPEDAIRIHPAPTK